MPTEESEMLNDAHLPDARAGWFRRLSRGCTWLIVACYAALVVPFIAVFLGVFAFAVAMGGQSAETDFLAMTIVVGALVMYTFVPVSLALIGAWMFTVPEPDQPPTVPESRSRLVARWAIVTALVLFAAGTVLGAVVGHFVPAAAADVPPVIAIIVAAAADVLAVIAKFIGYSALARYASGVARCFLEPGLANQLQTLRWVLLGVPPLFFLGFLSGGFFGLAIIAGAALWSLILIIRMKKALRRAAEQPGPAVQTPGA